jgi:hypothetical protein
MTREIKADSREGKATSVQTKDEQGRGVIAIVPELPIEHHISLVRGLLENLPAKNSEDIGPWAT